MVMLTEVLDERIAEKRRAEGPRTWSLADGPGSAEGDETTGRLGLRLSDMLSGDAQSFVDRQWQPYGE